VTDRAHFYAPILDGEGNIQPNSVVRILQPGTETLIVDPLYSDNTTVSSMSNPFVSVDGTMSFYLDTPQRVRVGITKPGFDEVFFDDIDVLVDATTTLDQTHTGAGTNSMSIGSGSVSGGAGSVALGNSAASAGAEGTAVGHSSNADGGDSTAMGDGSGLGSLLGQDALHRDRCGSGDHRGPAGPTGHHDRLRGRPELPHAQVDSRRHQVPALRPR
jgi:hypothetical protein